MKILQKSQTMPEMDHRLHHLTYSGVDLQDTGANRTATSILGRCKPEYARSLFEDVEDLWAVGCSPLQLRTGANTPTRAPSCTRDGQLAHSTRMGNLLTEHAPLFLGYKLVVDVKPRECPSRQPEPNGSGTGCISEEL